MNRELQRFFWRYHLGMVALGGAISLVHFDIGASIIIAAFIIAPINWFLS